MCCCCRGWMPTAVWSQAWKRTLCARAWACGGSFSFFFPCRMHMRRIAISMWPCVILIAVIPISVVIVNVLFFLPSQNASASYYCKCVCGGVLLPRLMHACMCARYSVSWRVFFPQAARRPNTRDDESAGRLYRAGTYRLKPHPARMCCSSVCTCLCACGAGDQ